MPSGVLMYDDPLHISWLMIVTARHAVS